MHTTARFEACGTVIQAHASVQFGHLRGVDREEALAEAMAWGYCNHRSAVSRGKAGRVTPSTIARRGVLSA
ncbi:MAG: hypothetical protein ACE5EQ_06560 [Phycisphaerae bacterium]